MSVQLRCMDCIQSERTGSLVHWGRFMHECFFCRAEQWWWWWWWWWWTN